MTSITRPRLSTMIQSSAISHSAYQQRLIRTPTIGAPEVVLSQQPAASLKRRPHIRRTSRSGNSPTSPEGRESQAYTASRRSRQDLSPLTTAFTRSVATSVSSGSILSGRPVCMDYPGMEWRNSPQYQPKMMSGGDISRRSTIASVYSLPSAAPHDSRRSTQENFILDWSVVDRALENRVESPVASPSYTRPPRDSPHRSCSIACQLVDGPTALSRSTTTQVRSLILDRQHGRNRI
ncbi:unnamed protein product [Rhizoctonia solani]|uniref:Uncharacterized protein n=1 Tax=Rhizoctonia solani TaxID=456999 RepID=A0A8H3DP46_9AGAM|nr:unnamed protein product [Rhizoctonia solani]